MPRLPVVADPQDPRVTAIYTQIKQAFGRVPNVLGTFANHGAIFVGIWELIRALFTEATLDPRLRELAYLRTSMLNECHY
jgi:alkylhydroperoxidase family enzyme